MPPPIKQTIKSEYHAEGIKAYLRDLKAIQEAQAATGQSQTAAARAQKQASDEMARSSRQQREESKRTRQSVDEIAAALQGGLIRSSEEAARAMSDLSRAFKAATSDEDRMRIAALGVQVDVLRRSFEMAAHGAAFVDQTIEDVAQALQAGAIRSLDEASMAANRLGQAMRAATSDEERGRIAALTLQVKELAESMSTAGGAVPRGLAAPATNAREAVRSLNFVLQDASMFSTSFQLGLMAIGNNIPFLVERIAELRSSTGSWKTALSSVGAAFMGPGGLVAIVSLATTLFIAFGDDIMAAFKGGSEASKEFKKQLDSVLSSMLEINRTGIKFTVDAADLEKTLGEIEKQITSRRQQLIESGLAAQPIPPSTAFLGAEAVEEELRARSQMTKLSEEEEEALRKQIATRERIAERLREEIILRNAAVETEKALRESGQETLQTLRDQLEAARERAEALQRMPLAEMSDEERQALAAANQEVQRLEEQIRALQELGIIDERDLERATEALGGLREALLLETVPEEFGRVRDALRGILEAQERIAELREVGATLGMDAVRDELEMAEALLEVERERLAEADAVRMAIERVAAEFNKMAAAPLGTLDPLERIQSHAENLERQITRLNNEFAAGAITERQFFEAMERASQNALEAITGLYEQFKALLVLTPELEAAFEAAFNAAKGGIKDAKDGVKELSKDTKRAAEAMQDMAAALRAVGRLADVFGDLNEGVSSLIQGTADVLDNLGRLAEFQATIGTEGGPAAGSLGAVAGQALPVIGIMAGFASIAGAIRGIWEARDARREAERRDLEALGKRIEEAGRRFEDAVERLIRSERVGGDVTSPQARAAEQALRAFELEMRRIRGDTPVGELTGRQASDIRDAFEAFLETVEDLQIPELEGLDLQAIFLDLLRERGVEGAIEAIMEEGFGDLPGLGNLIRTLFDDLGEYTNTVDGAIAALDAFSRFISTDAIEQLQFLTGRLLNLEGLSDEFRAALHEILTLDPATEADRERLREIIQDFAETFLDATEGAAEELLGDLSPEQFDAILQALLRFTEGAAEAADSVAATMDAWERFRIRVDLLGEDIAAAFEAFIRELKMTTSGLTEEGRTLLDEAAALDLSTEEGRERMREIARIFAAAMLTAEDEFGISDEDLERLFQLFMQTADRAVPEGEQFTRSVTNLRQLTEAQGAEVVFLLASLDFKADRRDDLLGGILSTLRGVATAALGGVIPPVVTASVARAQAPVVAPSAARSASPQLSSTVVNNFGDIVNQAPWTDREEMIRILVSDFEKHVRGLLR